MTVLKMAATQVAVPEPVTAAVEEKKA
jgi:hypothetical protein